MPRPPVKKRKIEYEKADSGFILGRDPNPVKPPTPAEIKRMRQRQIIRKNPHGTA